MRVGPGNVVANTTTYTGRSLDTETGLYYYRNRYYHAQLGRFVSRDPIGFLGGTNMYEFVNCRPNIFVDPMGLNPNQFGALDADDVIAKIDEFEYGYNLKYGRYPSDREVLKWLVDIQMQEVDFKSNHFYVYSELDDSWLDLRHFASSALHTGTFGCFWTQYGGHVVEACQYFGDSASAHGAEDIYSNDEGLLFWEAIKDDLFMANDRFSEKLAGYFEEQKIGEKAACPSLDKLPASEAEWDDLYHNHREVLEERHGAMIIKRKLGL
jgi:RHS repeat-associated protein